MSLLLHASNLIRPKAFVNICNLKELLSSIDQLNALQKLHLNGCCNLEKTTFIWNHVKHCKWKTYKQIQFCINNDWVWHGKTFSCIVAKGFKAIGKVNNILWLWPLDARKSSQEGMDLSTFCCTKKSSLKFFYFHKRNLFITIFSLHPWWTNFVIHLI